MAKKTTTKPLKLKGGLDENQDDGVLENALQKAQEQEIAKLVKSPPKLELPPENRPDMTAIERLEAEIDDAEKRDEEIALQVGTWMEDVSLPTLDKIEAMAKKIGDKVYKMSAGKNEDGQTITFFQQVEEYTRLNNSYMKANLLIGGEENPTDFPLFKTRRAAHMAFIKHQLKKKISREHFLFRVEVLVKEGYFIKNEKGKIRVVSDVYSLSDSEDFGQLDKDDETLLSEVINHQMSRFNSEEGEEHKKDATEMAKSSTIDLHQILSGGKGICFMHVPQDKYRNLPEVFLLVRGEGDGRLYIEEAVGFDQEEALEIKERKLFQSVDHLKYPPSVKHLSEPRELEDGSTRPPMFTEKEANHLLRFWTYLDRAKKELYRREDQDRRRELSAKAKAEAEEERQEAQAKAETLKEKYLKEATVSLDRVFLEEVPMEGIFFAEYTSRKPWRNKDGSTIPQGLLYFQGEVEVIEGEAFIRVKNAPDHLIDGTFFTEESFEFTSSGNNFQGLDQPLQGLMKILRRQVQKNVDAESETA